LAWGYTTFLPLAVGMGMAIAVVCSEFRLGIVEMRVVSLV